MLLITSAVNIQLTSFASYLLHHFVIKIIFSKIKQLQNTNDKSPVTQHVKPMHCGVSGSITFFRNTS
jgi:hypothetical protein